MSTEVFLDPVFEESPGVSKLYLPTSKIFTEFPVKLYNQKYFNDLAMRNYILESGSILLEEVTKIGQKREKDDGHYRIYSKPRASFKVTRTDLAYRNIADYLQGRAAGVLVMGDRILIRGPGSFQHCAPLFLINGFEVPEEIFLTIPMSDIDLVEVLKDPGELGIFGARGGNGVISVLTRKWGEEHIDPYSPGTIAKRIAGYSSCREFYSPTYTPENISSEKPDHRITLYWNPDIITEHGKASLFFFTSDDLSYFKVFVEGVTGNGKICLGTAEFSVDKYLINSGK